VNRFNGEVEFRSIFSNEQFIQSGYEWQFISDAADSPESINVNLTLSIEGHGAKNSQQKWNNALAGFSSKKYLLDDNSKKSSAYSSLYNVGAYRKCRPSSIQNFLSVEKAESSYYNGTVSSSKNYSDINRQSVVSNSSEKSVRQFSVYPVAGGARVIEHPQKTIGRSAISTKTFNPNLTLNTPPAPAVGELTESASTTYDFANRTIETKISTFTHS
jgi:hypothetical protein